MHKYHHSCPYCDPAIAKHVERLQAKKDGRIRCYLHPLDTYARLITSLCYHPDHRFKNGTRRGNRNPRSINLTLK